MSDLLHAQQQLHASGLLCSNAAKSSLLGLHHSRLRGRGMEFDQVRAYQSGDDVRNIDWRVTARTGEAHSKVFQEEREHPVFLIVEQSPAMFFASQGNFKSVQAAYIASLLAWAAHANHDRVGGLVFSETPYAEIRPQRHQRGVLKLLSQLAQANQKLTDPSVSSENNPLQQALIYSRSILKPGSLIIIICNERNISSHTSALIQTLAQRFDLILVPISDPLEHQLPHSRGLVFQQATRFLTIDGHQSNVGKQWQQLGEQYRQQWRKLAQQANLALFPLTTATSIAQQLTTLNSLMK
ncbi:DUF58 domain-containing protein [Thiopseudomonas acetoxidans]|uniref:DUF58 domain-containing protein n=1 Tax=Thiopseudomonas acetoxidans TaxID=3041622 RepID=A0ABT7SL64_9GAMM|nr:DUF58 domain-containing protein [Thiopseudomonas sp. CY1220]MDM7856931.1 DUF58 domain-containing protein [Thiopseudomonas sp. CY1220]